MGFKETVVLRVAKRWISGPDLPSALKDAKTANDKGMGVVVNFLGEEITDSAEADQQVNEYLRLQQQISDNGVEGFSSLKLTQFGLPADEAGAKARLELVAANAERLGQLQWIDMESSAVTDKTLEIYKDSQSAHKNVGLALQAYMRRSAADLPPLLERGAKIRLVKGAYNEKRNVVYPTREEVSKAYSSLMRMLFDGGDGFAVATHDAHLVEEAMRLSDSKHVDFRFEMLKGIRNDLKEDLVKSGYKVYEYLPYGDQWFAYSKRRITEHPSNLWLLIRSLV